MISSRSLRRSMGWSRDMVSLGLAAVAFSVLLLAGGGCGLLGSDLTSVKFDLPERSYTFDTAQTGVNLPAATLPEIPCDAATDCCALAAVASPGLDCNLIICDTASGAGVCALTAAIETPPPQQTIDLKKEVSALSGFSSQSVIDVTINKITYDVTSNTLNTPLPSVELFVGPNGAATTTDPGVKRFGTVPPIAAGTTVTGGNVVLDPQGQEAFKGYAHNFGTPFVFMARTVVVVPGGAPLPTGAISLKIKGQLKANPGL